MVSCQSGLRCPNPQCQHPNNWGESDIWVCAVKILNKMNLMKKKYQRIYYDGLVRCNNATCNFEARQISVHEGSCLRPGCNGRIKSVCSELALQTQLEYFDSLFDIDHASGMLNTACWTTTSPTENEALRDKWRKRTSCRVEREVFQLLRGFSSHSLNKNSTLDIMKPPFIRRYLNLFKTVFLSAMFARTLKIDHWSFEQFNHSRRIVRLWKVGVKYIY